MYARIPTARAVAFSLLALGGSLVLVAHAADAPARADGARTTRYKPATSVSPATAETPAVATTPAAAPSPKRNRERTIAPFPVPGDTSALSVLRWRTLNLPRTGITTVAPLPVPGAMRSRGAVDTSGLSPRDAAIRKRMAKHEQDCVGYFADELPEPIHREEPVTPPGVPLGNSKRIVRVFAFIGEDGKVEVAETHGAPSPLDSAAVACVLKWRFKPARHCEHAQPVWVVVPIRFDVR